jgi:hypothetical protein
MHHPHSPAFRSTDEINFLKTGNLLQRNDAWVRQRVAYPMDVPHPVFKETREEQDARDKYLSN